MKKYDYEGFLDNNTYGYDSEEVTLTPQEIVEYMRDNDEMPEGVELWEAVEGCSPAYLVKHGLGFIDPLTAAAPELLAALEEIAKFQASDPAHKTDWKAQVYKTKDIARQAIAKAKGE